MACNISGNKPICIDLCCGAGGLSYGFEKAGFDVTLGIDINRKALHTFQRNIPVPETICSHLNIRVLKKKQILNHLPLSKQKIDGVLASPPCQGFSQSNRRSRTMNNPLNSLYLDIMRLIKEIRPQWFLIENVWGLQQIAEGFVKKHIIQLGKSMGYHVAFKILNAVDYNIPQFRRRVFFIGTIKNIDFIFPKPTSKRYITVREAIGDLPSLHNGERRELLAYKLWGNCISTYQLQMRGTRKRTLVNGNLVTRNNQLVKERYKFIPPGGNWRNIPKYLMTNYKDQSLCHTGIYRRLELDKPSVVISNYRKNMLIHPEEDRGLSVREAARLQSFPDSFVFKGCLGSQQQQVADAVPPLLAFALATAIMQQVYFYS